VNHSINGGGEYYHRGIIMKKCAVLVFIVVCLPMCAFGEDGASVARKMITSVKQIRTITYTMESKERIEGKMVPMRASMKVNVDPFMVYVYQYVPVKGLECLYKKGENGGKMKVNPAAFPWATLNLDPQGSLALKNKHHPIMNAGFTYMVSLLEYLLNKYGDDAARNITLTGSDTVKGVPCYRLVFRNPGYKMISYTVGKGETPLSIARKLRINYQSILENNSSVDGLGKIDKGTVLAVPNDYASSMEMYIHKEMLYPVRLVVSDLKGVFSDYTFTEVVINPAFNNADFSDNNPEYGFK
jgi:outer membrane lipoprotein-sorting protein